MNVSLLAGFMADSLATRGRWEDRRLADYVAAAADGAGADWRCTGAGAAGLGAGLAAFSSATSASRWVTFAAMSAFKLRTWSISDTATLATAVSTVATMPGAASAFLLIV